MKLIDKCKSSANALGLAVALCFAAAPAAQATVLGDYLTFDGPQHTGQIISTQGGGEDKLQDDSLSRLNNNDGSVNAIGLPTFTTGDTLFGIITLSDITASGRPNVGVGGAGTPGQVAILYATTNTGLAGLPFPLASVSNMGGASGLLTSLCGAVCAPAGILATTVAVVLTSTTPDTNPANDPLNTTGTVAAINTFFNSGLWKWEATLGLTGDSFFQFNDGGLTGSTERGAFDITSSALAATYLPVDVSDFTGAKHLNDVTLDTGTVNFGSDTVVARDWTFTDQGTFYINPLAIPEPGALALLGIALAGAAGVSRRRRGQ